jgi:hypothetical protein
MWGVIGSNRHWRGLAPSALALLLLFRLLIPAGYMIAPDHQGRPGLVLCAAPARESAQPERHAGHVDRSADKAPSKLGERPCPFAALAAPPLPPAPPAIPPRAPAAVVAPDLPPADLPRVARAAPSPPATGPPLFV